MYVEDIKPFVGEIMILDLVSGLQVVAEITGVDDTHVLVKHPTIFQISAQPADPSMPPGPNNPMQQAMQAIPFGGPFTRPLDERPFDLRHVMALHAPIDPIEKAWMQATSGIQVAGAGALNELDKQRIQT